MNIRLLYLSFKNLKIYYFIPLFFLYIFLPVLNFGMVSMSGNIENSYILVFREAEKYIPLLSFWWITLIFKEYISGDGNEVLYCIDSSGKVKLSLIAPIFLWYIIHVGVLFLGYSIFWDNVLLEFIKTVLQCFFFVSLGYMLMYISESPIISFMLLLIYELLTIFINSNIANYISIFENGNRITMNAIATKYLGFLLLSIAFLVIGVYKNKRFYY